MKIMEKELKIKLSHLSSIKKFLVFAFLQTEHYIMASWLCLIDLLVFMINYRKRYVLLYLKFLIICISFLIKFGLLISRTFSSRRVKKKKKNYLSFQKIIPGWNRLPDDVVTAEATDIFKTRLADHRPPLLDMFNAHR